MTEELDEQPVTLLQASELLGIPIRRLYRWSSWRGDRPPRIKALRILADGAPGSTTSEIRARARTTRRGRPLRSSETIWKGWNHIS